MPQPVKPQYLRLQKTRPVPGFLIKILCLFVLIYALPIIGEAQEVSDYDEISVFFNVQRVGGFDIPAIIHDETVYLPITEIFSILKIKNVPSAQFDSVTGFFLNQQAAYLIDKQNNQIIFQGKVHQLKSENMIKTEDNLYLRSDFFGQVFGLDCNFNFRSLSVMLTSKLELPVIREMRQVQMRANISRLKGEIKTDTTIGRKYPAFHFGMADWSVISSQQVNGHKDTRFNLALGTVIAGGEANANLIFNNNQPFREKQQQYLWRFVNNDFSYMRQLMAGKIAAQATSSLYAPVVGVQVTNNPTTFRRSFGSYTLSDRTEPGWTVELYVNNVIVDYTKADASGFFTFQVPLVYGNSAVMLKFYGPWGEERSKEQNISIPFNFLPVGELQYTASAGIVEDSMSSRFSRANVNYGLAGRVTVGAGTEYLSSVKSGSFMPFVNTSVRLASSLLLSGEYTYGVRSKAILSYRFPSNMQFELYYAQYEKGQKAINYNYLQERKAVFSVPLRAKTFSAFTRFTFNQIILPESKYTTGEMLLSGAMYGVSANLTTYGMFVNPNKPYVYSNLALSFGLPAAFVLIPQAQYEYNNQKLISLKCGLEKHVFKNGFFNVSYEQNFKNKIRNIEFGFRYDLSFVQAAFTARQTNSSTMFTESARGSLMVDRKSHYLHAGNRTSVGKGAIVIIPYLDLNCNGKRDADEPRVSGLNIHITGGRIEFDENDTTIRIFDLEPYASYIIEFDRNSFENISWQLRYKNMKVTVDPNQFKLVEVPISVFGEASGMVYYKGSGSQKGLARVIICFYNKAGKLVGRTLSESDGYFSFLGLPPGNYITRIDTTQLRKINMVSTPVSIPITITSMLDGDVKDDLQFTLNSLKQEPVDTNAVAKVEIPRNTAKIEAITKPVSDVAIPNQPGNTRYIAKYYEANPLSGTYAIQIGAFSKVENALKAWERLILVLGKDVIILKEGGFYKVMLPGFDEYGKAKAFLPLVKIRGYEDAFVFRINEVSGMVYLRTPGSQKGLGDVVINFLDQGEKILGTTLTDPEGHFSFLGLPIGRFTAEIDTIQMQMVNMEFTPASIPFEFERTQNSKVNNNLEFNLRSLYSEAVAQKATEPAAQKKSEIAGNIIPRKDLVKAKPSVTLPSQPEKPIKQADAKSIILLPGNYVIQVGAFTDHGNALKTRNRLIDALAKDVFIIEDEGLFKVMVTGFMEREKVEAFLPGIKGRGFVEAFIIKIK